MCSIETPRPLPEFHLSVVAQEPWIVKCVSCACPSGVPLVHELLVCGSSAPAHLGRRPLTLLRLLVRALRSAAPREVTLHLVALRDKTAVVRGAPPHARTRACAQLRCGGDSLSVRNGCGASTCHDVVSRCLLPSCPDGFYEISRACGRARGWAMGASRAQVASLQTTIPPRLFPDLDRRLEDLPPPTPRTAFDARIRSLPRTDILHASNSGGGFRAARLVSMHNICPALGRGALRS